MGHSCRNVFVFLDIEVVTFYKEAVSVCTPLRDLLLNYGANFSGSLSTIIGEYQGPIRLGSTRRKGPRSFL